MKKSILIMLVVLCSFAYAATYNETVLWANEFDEDGAPTAGNDVTDLLDGTGEMGAASCDISTIVTAAAGNPVTVISAGYGFYTSTGSGSPIEYYELNNVINGSQLDGVCAGVFCAALKSNMTSLIGVHTGADASAVWEWYGVNETAMATLFQTYINAGEMNVSIIKNNTDPTGADYENVRGLDYATASQRPRCFVEYTIAAGASKNLYIDTDSIGGACSNAYTRAQNNITHPWCNTSQILTKALANDTVIFRDGVYNGQVWFNTVTYDPPLKITNYPGEHYTWIWADEDAVTVPNACWINKSNNGINLWRRDMTACPVDIQDEYAYVSFTNGTYFYPYEALAYLNSTSYGSFNGMYVPDDDTDLLYIRFNDSSIDANNIPLYVSKRDYAPIRFSNAYGVEIYNGTFRNNNNALYAYQSGNITFQGNNVTGGTMPIRIRELGTKTLYYNIDIVDNIFNGTIRDEDYLYWYYVKDYNYVYGHVEGGVTIAACDYGCDITDNIIQGYYDGIQVKSDATDARWDNSQIVRNTIYNNFDDAMEIEDYFAGINVSDNKIYDTFVALSIAFANCTSTCYMENNKILVNKRIWAEPGNQWGGECWKLDRDDSAHWVINHNTCVANVTGETDRGMWQQDSGGNLAWTNFTNNIVYVVDGYAYDRTDEATQDNYYNFNALWRETSSSLGRYWNNNGASTVYSLAGWEASANYEPTWETDSMQSDPLIKSFDPSSSDFLVPASDSPVCGAASDGGDIGALPCAPPSFYNYEPNITVSSPLNNSKYNKSNRTLAVTLQCEDENIETVKVYVYNASGAVYYNYNTYGLYNSYHDWNVSDSVDMSIWPPNRYYATAYCSDATAAPSYSAQVDTVFYDIYTRTTPAYCYDENLEVPEGNLLVNAHQTTYESAYAAFNITNASIAESTLNYYVKFVKDTTPNVGISLYFCANHTLIDDDDACTSSNPGVDYKSCVIVQNLSMDSYSAGNWYSVNITQYIVDRSFAIYFIPSPTTYDATSRYIRIGESEINASHAMYINSTIYAPAYTTNKTTYFDIQTNLTVRINDPLGGYLSNIGATVGSQSNTTTGDSITFWVDAYNNYTVTGSHSQYIVEDSYKYIAGLNLSIALNTTGQLVNDIYLEDKVLLDSSNSLKCYTNISLNNITNTVLTYWWTNSSNDTIKTGTTLCEHENLCEVDDLTNVYISAHDGFTCWINVTQGSYIATNHTDMLNKSTIGLCAGTLTYPIANISYFDEETEASIYLDAYYSILLYDGVGSVAYEYSFLNDSYDTLCTDIDPAVNIITLLLYGNITLQKLGYNTRTFYIPYGAGFTVSNDPMANISLYLLGLTNSTTMTYNWYTTSYEPIDGSMLIYRCNIDGSRTLIDSPLIADGVATANILAYTTAYSYEVNIDGTTYTDDSYTACHVESTTERTFFVDTTVPVLESLAELYGASCKVWQSDTDEVKMSWDADSVVEACVEAYRGTVSGKVQIYESCVNASSGTTTRTIANNTYTYYVIGTLSDGTTTAYCPDTVVITVQTDAQSSFGVYGAFAVGLLILAFVLLFSPDGQLQVVIAGFAAVISFGLGLIAFGWPAVVMLIVFLLAALIVGRYRKKQ